MLGMRHSGETRVNPEIQDLAPKTGEGNRAWLERTKADQGVILLGGSSLIEFRIRVAQSRLRNDLFPSYWSMVGILRRNVIDTVADVRDLARVPAQNAVQSIRLSEIDSADRFPNIAVIQFTDDHRAIRDAVRQVQSQRSIVDLPSLVVAWLAYAWGVPEQSNPLLEGKGLPSAVLVRTAHAIAGIELMPGHTLGTSCPEAIWQAARWWSRFYEEESGKPTARKAVARSPSGFFGLRQREAIAVG
jgi:hypothetical protein